MTSDDQPRELLSRFQSVLLELSRLPASDLTAGRIKALHQVVIEAEQVVEDLKQFAKQESVTK